MWIATPWQTTRALIGVPTCALQLLLLHLQPSLFPLLLPTLAA